MNETTARSCLTPEEFDALVEGRLPPDREAACRRHLDECTRCRTRFAQMGDEEQIFEDLREARRHQDREPLTHTRAPSAPPRSVGSDASVVIEGYSIQREVGRGGMGVVFEAVQQRLNRKVALKILPGSSGLRDHDAVSRFRREATAAARLHHTNIVPVYDFGESGGAHYYAMELVEGRPLTEMIRRLASANAPSLTQDRLDRMLRDATEIEPPGSSATFNKADSFASSGSVGGSSATSKSRVYYRHVARWMADAADALHYAHDQGIIHRDIKPSNLLLARDGRIMILDFGLAKSQGDFSVTMTGAIVGTLRYMSPEQAMAKRMKVDHRTDIYSLGATMYEMLTFQPAFAGHDDKETLGLIITRDATAPRKINSTVPRELETICLKALEKDPGARYATAKALADDLRRFMNDLPIFAKPPGPIGRSIKFMRRRRATSVAILATLLLTASGAATVWYAKDVRKQRAERIDKLVNLGGEHLGRGEITQAEAEFTEVIGLDPDNYRALVNLATVKRYQFDLTHEELRLDEAIDLIGRALEKDPSRAEHWNVKGVILRLRNRLPESIEAHEQGIKINAGYFANWVSLANVYVLQGKFEKAEECLLRGTQLPGTSAGGMPWHNLAAVQLHLRKTQARHSCDEALNISRRDAACVLLLSKLLLTMPGTQNPREALDAAITADGLTSGNQKNARVKRFRAFAELRLQHLEDAVASAEEAISLNDKLPFPYLILSIAESKLGRSEKSREHFAQAKALWPTVPEGQTAVATVMQGGLVWIESLDDLSALRTEAEAALNRH